MEGRESGWLEERLLSDRGRDTKVEQLETQSVDFCYRAETQNSHPSFANVVGRGLACIAVATLPHRILGHAIPIPLTQHFVTLHLCTRLTHNAPLQFSVESLLLALGKYACLAREQQVNLLQWNSSRLGVKQPYDESIHEVEHSPDDVRSPPDILQRFRRDLHDEKVSTEIRGCSESCSTCSDFEREDFRRVLPHVSGLGAFAGE